MTSTPRTSQIYNTMRELSNRNREIWAMMALNETFFYEAGATADPGALPDVGRPHPDDDEARRAGRAFARAPARAFV